MGVDSSTPPRSSSAPPSGSSDICITPNPPHCQRAGNSTAIAISQAIADVGLCFVLQLRLSLTLRVPHSPLSSHICPIILSAAPMGALLYARVPNDEVECPTIEVPYCRLGCPTIGWGALQPAPLLSTGFRRRATVCCASYKFSDGVIEPQPALSLVLVPGPKHLGLPSFQIPPSDGNLEILVTLAQ